MADIRAGQPIPPDTDIEAFVDETSLKSAIRHSVQCYLAEHVHNVRAELERVHRAVYSLWYLALGLLTEKMARGTYSTA